jgi:hypothetical protein
MAVAALVASLSLAADVGPNYAELFSFPEKAKLDAKQKEKLAALRTANEKNFKGLDQACRVARGKAAVHAYQRRAQLVREIIRQKNAILTEEQKKTLGIKTIIPTYADGKQLKDPKVWDVEQLTAYYTIQSMSYDAEKQVISLMIITKKALTPAERAAEARLWQDGKVRFLVYNKDKLLWASFDASEWYLGLSRTSAKLTSKEEKEGLQRFLVKIDLGMSWGGAKDGRSVKFVYPPLK